jgi:hypothetical protein
MFVMGNPCGKPALLCSAVVLAVSAVVPVASGIAATTEASAVPSKLVGQWTRAVTFADRNAHGGGADGFCRLTVTKSGAAHLRCINIGTFDGKIASAGTNRVHITLFDATPNVYRWRVSGGRLTLTALTDDTPNRAGVMWGVWKRP